MLAQEPEVEEFKTRCEVRLKVEGRKCDLEKITEATGIVPAEIRFTNGECNGYSAEQLAYWIYKIEMKETLDIEQQVDELEAVFASKVYLLRKLKKLHSFKIGIDVVSEIAGDETPCLCFSSSFLRMVSKLGAELNIILRVYQEQLDTVKVDNFVENDDIYGFASYVQNLSKAEQDKGIEYLMSRKKDISEEGVKKQFLDFMNQPDCQNIEGIWMKLMDIYLE